MGTVTSPWLSPFTRYSQPRCAWPGLGPFKRVKVNCKYANGKFVDDYQYDDKEMFVIFVIIYNIFAFEMCTIPTCPLESVKTKCLHAQWNSRNDFTYDHNCNGCPICHHLRDIRDRNVHILWHGPYKFRVYNGVVNNKQLVKSNSNIRWVDTFDSRTLYSFIRSCAC